MSAATQDDGPLSVPEKLGEWNLSQYIGVFQAQAIDDKKFIVITTEDVKELIPILGHRMDFLSNRLAYLKSQGLPDPDELFANLDDTVSLVSDSTSASTTTSLSEAVAEVPRPGSEPGPITGEQLKRLLQKSPKGQALLRCIRLTSHDRKKLCEIIIDHVMIHVMMMRLHSSVQCKTN